MALSELSLAFSASSLCNSTTMSTLALDREERLAAVLDVLAAQRQAGQAVDWVALRNEHPDLIDEIRQLLAVGQIVEGLAKSSGATTIALRKSRKRPQRQAALCAKSAWRKKCCRKRN